MAKNLELNSLIHGQYPNQASFANAIGWQKPRLSTEISSLV